MKRDFLIDTNPKGGDCGFCRIRWTNFAVVLHNDRLLRICGPCARDLANAIGRIGRLDLRR